MRWPLARFAGAGGRGAALIARFGDRARFDHVGALDEGLEEVGAQGGQFGVVEERRHRAPVEALVGFDAGQFEHGRGDVDVADDLVDSVPARMCGPRIRKGRWVDGS